MRDDPELIDEIRRLAQSLDQRSRAVDPSSVIATGSSSGGRSPRRWPRLAVAVAAFALLVGAGVVWSVTDDRPGDRRIDTRDDPPTSVTTTTATATTTTTVPAPPTTVGTRYEGVSWYDLPDAGVGLLDADGSIVLLGLDGVQHATLTGPVAAELGSAPPPATLAVDTGRHQWLADPAQAPPGCERAAGGGGVRVALCGGEPIRTQIVRVDPDGGSQLLVGAAPGAAEGSGHWRWAAPSPDGRWVLAQHSGECEVPTAFFVGLGSKGVRTATGERSLDGAPESLALGWAPDGRAIVQLGDGACGTGVDEPGIYLVDPATTERTLVRAVPSSTAALLWQKAGWFPNPPERIISRALQELGLEECCGEPAHGSPTATTGVTWDGVEIGISGVPRSMAEPDTAGRLTVTCGDHHWTFGAWWGSVPDDVVRAAADAIVPHLYCTVEPPPG